MTMRREAITEANSEGGGENLAFAMKSVAQLRRHSIAAPHSVRGGPPMNIKHGSLASSFFAPHPTPGHGVCFSPSGDLLLRFGYCPEVKLLRSSNLSLVCTLKGSVGAVRYATFSHDGDFIIATTDDCKLLVFKTEKALSSGHALPFSTIDVGNEPLLYCIMCGDGRSILSCDDDGQLELWDVEAETMARRFDPGHSSKLANLTMAGTRIVSCSDGVIGVVMLDLDSAEVLWSEEFNGLSEGRNKAAYTISNNGNWVIAYIVEQTWSDNLAIFDTRTHKHTNMKVCAGTVLHVEFSANGELFLVAGRDDRIHVYSCASCDLLGVLEGHTTDVMFCRASHNRRFAISGDNAGHVLIWDLTTFTCRFKLQAHKLPVLLCDLSSDGMRAFSLDNEGNSYMWYLDTKGIFDVIADDSKMLCSCALTHGSTHMAVGYSDGIVKLWNLGLEMFQIWESSAHSSPVVSLAISPKGDMVASGCRDGKVQLSSFDSGAMLATIKSEHADLITAIRFSGSGSIMLTSCRDGCLKVWDGLHKVSSGGWKKSPKEPLLTLHGPSEIVDCALSHDGKLIAAACAGGEVAAWSAVSGNLIFAHLVTDLGSSSVQFSHDGRHLLAGSLDGSTAVFDVVEGGVLVHTLCANAAGVNAAFFEEDDHSDEVPVRGLSPLAGVKVNTLCSRQVISWDLGANGNRDHVTDFLPYSSKDFNATAPRIGNGRTFIAHDTLSFYDLVLDAAIYDMREFEEQPGNSYLFRNGTTAVLRVGVHQQPLVMFATPDQPIAMLMAETGGAKALDFSSDGHLIVSGNIRGELSIWDVECHQHVKTWMAHKRSSITCVRFSHDSKTVYSCGEDAKVIVWDWRTCERLALLSGHESPVVSVERSHDGTAMVSGDKDGCLIIWDPGSNTPMQIIAAHDGPVLCCTISPDGKHVASSGVDEHISIRDSRTGKETISLDDALDGKGMTIKFSFCGTRLQVGGENGNILVWSVEKNCLMYEIKAHEGKVYDCSWSGDSRQLLSVGSDGKVRLWDSAAGSEICQANFEVGFGDVDTGGFIRCDISSNGSTMAGCTAKGHLIQWDVHKELRRIPIGGTMYRWLESMPVSKAREMYAKAQLAFPLLMNAQDSRGWTLLMHAVANSNPEITKLIVGNVKPKSGVLGLVTSELRNSPGMSSNSHEASAVFAALQRQQAVIRSNENCEGASGCHAITRPSGGTTPSKSRISLLRPPHASPLEPATLLPSPNSEADESLISSASSPSPRVSRQLSDSHLLALETDGYSAPGGETKSTVSALQLGFNRMLTWAGWRKELASIGRGSGVDHDHMTGFNESLDTENVPTNALSIAIRASSADCVSLLLDAVLAEKVTAGSYMALTNAIPDVAQNYPEMCHQFFRGLPLLVLGDIEIPSSIASQGTIVRASTSYTSYKEMWQQTLNLSSDHKGPMVVMEASMVRLPYAASIGKGSILHTLVDSDVPVQTFGSDTVKAIINYKWKHFAMWKIFTKALVYLVFIAVFTVYAVLRVDDNPSNTLEEAMLTSNGRIVTILSVIIFCFGLYYLILEVIQLSKLGVMAYIFSFWNLIDVASYSICLVIAPCQLARYGLQYDGFIWPLVAVETILLWVKAGFFGLAVDGLGTFIYMTSEIVKGMRFFILLLLILWTMFAVAFMNLFPVSYAIDDVAISTPPDSPYAPLSPGGQLPPGSEVATVDTSTAAIDPTVDELWVAFNTFGKALMSAYMTTYNPLDPSLALPTRHAVIAIILICLFDFVVVLLFTNMLITLMGEIYSRIREKQLYVFLENRADLVIEVESTMRENQITVPPFLHLLTPIHKKDENEGNGDKMTEAQKMTAVVEEAFRNLEQTPSTCAPGPPGAVPDPTSDTDTATSRAASRRDVYEPQSAAQSMSGYEDPVDVQRSSTVSRLTVAIPRHNTDPTDSSAPSPSSGGQVRAKSQANVQSIKSMQSTKSRGRLVLGMPASQVASPSGGTIAGGSSTLTELLAELSSLRKAVQGLTQAVLKNQNGPDGQRLSNQPSGSMISEPPQQRSKIASTPKNKDKDRTSTVRTTFALPILVPRGIIHKARPIVSSGGGGGGGGGSSRASASPPSASPITMFNHAFKDSAAGGSAAGGPSLTPTLRRMAAEASAAAAAGAQNHGLLAGVTGAAGDEEEVVEKKELVSELPGTPLADASTHGQKGT